MSLFKRKGASGPTLEELQEKLKASEENASVFMAAVRALLIFLKEFTFDLKEIGSDEFKRRMDDLEKQFESEEGPKRARRELEEGKRRILEFIGKEGRYFREKERELKNIAQVLLEGMNQLIGENRDFNSMVYESNLRVEQITYLDDLRKIRESLKTEVAEMKRVVQEKQAKDTERVQTLSREVDLLKNDLEKAEHASMMDGLTGVHNRLAFDVQIKKMVDRAVIARSPFSLILCDLDNFKAINDTYGHQVGDRVLKAFSRECSQIFRKDDFIARYGGEEFAVILPMASIKDAVKRARILCETVASKQYVIDPERPERLLAFTLTAGVSSHRKNDTVESVLERADKALYEGKHGGKNRVVSE